MENCYWVYIVTNKPYGTLYTGLTANLPRRIHEHRNKIIEGFTKKYGLDKLVYYEEYPTFQDAVEREKKLKRWARDWKKQLVDRFNPTWSDPYETLNA